LLSLPKIASAVAATAADVSVAAVVAAAGNNPMRLSIDDVFDMGAVSGVESPEREIDLLFGGCGCGCGFGLLLSKLTILLVRSPEVVVVLEVLLLLLEVVVVVVPSLFLFVAMVTMYC